MSDEQLLARFMQGHHGCFEELVERYSKEIYRFLVRFTGRAHLAEDLIQDVFMKVYRSAGTFDSSKKFRPWLYSIAANRARDVLRGLSRIEKQIVVQNAHGDYDTSLTQLVAGEAIPPDQNLIEHETTEKVQEALLAMPESLREILILAYYDQMPYKQIAESLDIPLGTVKSRLHKAVNTFGEIWKRYEPDQGR